MQRALLKLTLKSIAGNDTLAAIFGVIYLGGIVLSVILGIVYLIYWLIDKFHH